MRPGESEQVVSTGTQPTVIRYGRDTVVSVDARDDIQSALAERASGHQRVPALLAAGVLAGVLTIVPSLDRFGFGPLTIAIVMGTALSGAITVILRDRVFAPASTRRRRSMVRRHRHHADLALGLVAVNRAFAVDRLVVALVLQPDIHLEALKLRRTLRMVVDALLRDPACAIGADPALREALSMLQRRSDAFGMRQARQPICEFLRIVHQAP